MTGLGDSALLLSAPDGQSKSECRIAWTVRKHLGTGTENMHPTPYLLTGFCSRQTLSAMQS